MSQARHVRDRRQNCWGCVATFRLDNHRTRINAHNLQLLYDNKAEIRIGHDNRRIKLHSFVGNQTLALF